MVLLVSTSGNWYRTKYTVLSSTSCYAGHLMIVLVTFGSKQNSKIWQIQILIISNTCKIWDIFCWLQIVIVTIAFFSLQKKGERNQLKVRVKHWKNIIFSNFLRYWKRPNRFGNSSVFCKPYSSLILYPVIQVFYKPRKKCERYQGPWSWCWGSYYILVHTTRYFYLIWNCCYWIVWTSTQMGNMFCWSWRYSEAGQ